MQMAIACMIEALWNIPLGLWHITQCFASTKCFAPFPKTGPSYPFSLQMPDKMRFYIIFSIFAVLPLLSFFSYFLHTFFDFDNTMALFCLTGSSECLLSFSRHTLHDVHVHFPNFAVSDKARYTFMSCVHTEASDSLCIHNMIWFFINDIEGFYFELHNSWV